MPPEDTLWDYEEHTRAKHRLLVKYLQAWLPVMAQRNKVLNIIDGFAGPGRYKGGEPGSPLLVLDAYIGHTRKTPEMERVTVNYGFIELDPRRVAHLRSEIARISLPANVKVEVTEGPFDAVIAAALDEVPAGHVWAPTFAFIDPFGYTGHSLPLSSRILQFPKCEVLIYVPLPYIARFVDDPKLQPSLDNLFGDSSWRAAVGHAGKEAWGILHELFLERVRKAAGFAISFEVDAAKDRGWAGYNLYFGTSNVAGIEHMKRAMWNVDPAGGARFAYVKNPDQVTMFEAQPDLSELEGQLKEHFGMRPFSIEEAERFTTIRTPFAAGMHLKRGTLKVAEDGGRLEPFRPAADRRRGTYPPGTRLRFK